MREASKNLTEAMAKASLKTIESELSSVDAVKNMSPANLAMLHSYIELAEAVCAYNEKAAELMESIDKKLEELLQNTGKSV